MKDKLKIEPDPGGPRINANAVNGLIREAFREGARVGTYNVACDRALRVGRQCVSNLTDAEIIAIAKGEAELHGVTPGPIGYRAVEVPK